MVLSPLITNTRLLAIPKNTGFGPVVTWPTMVSPATSMCRVLLLLEGAGLVDKTMAWAKAPASPPGLLMGIINCRRVSLQPAAASTKTAVTAAGHSFLKLRVIPTPPVFSGMNARTWDFLRTDIVSANQLCTQRLGFSFSMSDQHFPYFLAVWARPAVLELYPGQHPPKPCFPGDCAGLRHGADSGLSAGAAP